MQVAIEINQLKIKDDSEIKTHPPTQPFFFHIAPIAYIN